MDVINFIDNYIQNLIELLRRIDKLKIKKVVELLEICSKKNGKVYIIGNGGSAATASHMVNDWGVGLKRRGIKNFNIISLADNTPVCTALANDVGYENIFYMQLKDILKEDDILIAISCSGNSSNIVKAVEYAKKHNITVVGLSGFDGGKLKELSDISLHIDTPKGEYGLVEDIHLIFNHIIYSYYIGLKKE